MIKGLMTFIGLTITALIVYTVWDIPVQDINIMTRGYIPRALAWTFLALGVYGLVRRSFPIWVMILCYLLAFFFTFLGPYFMRGIY